MAFQRAPQLPSPPLPAGTQVDDWLLVECHAQGSYGFIYRALRIGQEEAGPVAFKLAAHPWDPRFAREAELLLRIHHPRVPRLLGRGVWRPSHQVEHPYLIMEWIDGTPLYEWARQRASSIQQAPQVLASVARALEATHAAQAVHRDVKGANVLVRHSDGQAVLTDFGSGYFQGASRLTWQSLPPGTPAYRSPASGLFLLRSVRAPNSWFQATPADDLFALGVTAFRLVTGEYPPDLEPLQDEAGRWHITSADLRPLLERYAQADPRLRECILRMLSVAPEARGTAEELARNLEAIAKAPLGSAATKDRSSPRVRARVWRAWHAVAAGGLAWGLVWGAQAIRGQHEPALACTRDIQDERGTTAVGDSSPAASLASVQVPDARPDLAQSPLPEPRPGQVLSDEKGRCPGRKQVSINGGCWVEQPSMDDAECKENGYAFSRGRCYAPALQLPRQPQPTSTPSTPP